MIVEENLKKTPLYNDHVALNARMVPFGGWEMPVQYESILAEYEHTRKAATLFDTSHMGEFLIEGDCVETRLDYLVTMTIASMPNKSCRYGMLVNDKGGVIDDLIVFRVDQEKWFIVVNGGTTQKDADHFCSILKDPSVFQDISAVTGKLDLQGPLSREILKKYVPEIGKLDYYTFDYFDLLGENVLISRTGYTGELGYEIYYPSKKTSDLWKELLSNTDVKPAGLGARDLLRLEMGYSLYGHELSDETSPLESGLSKFIDFDKDFFGKDALLKQQQEGLKRKIIGFTADNRRSPREGHKIYSASGEEIGSVTSGTFSPAFQKGIGLGFVNRGQGEKGDTIYFGNEKNKIEANITGRFFYKKGSLKD